MTLPDLESLRCFAAGAKHLNFRLAARTVALSPAAFGDRIKRLESDLDARLFERTTRRVRLTAAGERLLPQAKRCLDEAARCRETVADENASVPFALTIGTRFELGMSWLLPSLGVLEDERAERQLHLAFGDTAALLDALQRGTIDCLITSARITRSGLNYARLHEERYVFVGKKELLAKRPLRKCEQAGQHRLLELNSELPLFRYFLDARPGSEVWAFEQVQHLGTIAPVRARLLEGAGVAVLPHYFVENDVRSGKLSVIMPRVKMPVDWFRLIWLEGHPRDPQLRELAQRLNGIPLR